MEEYIFDGKIHSIGSFEKYILRRLYKYDNMDNIRRQFLLVLSEYLYEKEKEKCIELIASKLQDDDKFWRFKFIHRKQVESALEDYQTLGLVFQTSNNDKGNIGD